MSNSSRPDFVRAGKQENPAGLRVMPDGAIWVTGVPCNMKCIFCLNSISRKEFPDTPSVIRSRNRNDSASILKTIDALLRKTPGDAKFRISADDLLNYSRIFDILDLFRRHKRHFELSTPGLRFADRNFARKISAYNAHFIVSLHSLNPRTYRLLTGNREGLRLILRGLDNLCRYGVHFDINCVITSLNCADIASVAAYVIKKLGKNSIQFCNVNIDGVMLERKPDISGLYPHFALIREQLSAISRDIRSADASIMLTDIPPCQTGPDVMRDHRFAFQFVKHCYHPVPPIRRPGCLTCTADTVCSHLPRWYPHRVRINPVSVANSGPRLIRQP